MLAAGELRPLEVSTRVAPLDDAPRALTDAFRGGVFKTVLVE